MGRVPRLHPVQSCTADAAKAGLGKQSADEIAASLKQKFPVFTKEELLTDLEYGGTPLSRAVINVNVAFQELGKK